MAVYDKERGGYRIFIGDIGSRVGRYDLEREFDRCGQVSDVWVARNPPGFAFIVYKYPEDAERAVKDMDGRMVCGRRVRVEHANQYKQKRKEPNRYGRGPPPRFRDDRDRYRRSRSGSRSRRRSLSRSRSRSPDYRRGSYQDSKERRSSGRRSGGYRGSSKRDEPRDRSRSISKSRSPSPAVQRNNHSPSPGAD